MGYDVIGYAKRSYLFDDVVSLAFKNKNICRCCTDVARPSPLDTEQIKGDHVYWSWKINKFARCTDVARPSPLGTGTLKLTLDKHWTQKRL